METVDFLQELYDRIPSGALSVTYLDDKRIPHTKWFEKDQLPEMAKLIHKAGRKYNTYIGVNPRKDPLGEWARGDQDSIMCVVALYQDYDIKGPAHAEKNLPPSREELITFIDGLERKPSLLVYSGNGIHSYWLFQAPYLIHNETELQYIDGISKGWEQHVKNRALTEHGWKFDSVGDLARMLRAPGSLNHKTPEKTVCEIIGVTAVRYEVSDFESFSTGPSVVASSTGPKRTDDEDEFALMGTGDARELIEKCSFLQHCRDEAASLSEPYWYAGITNLAPTRNGCEVIHEISEPYPGYSYEETQKKYLHAAREDKPVSCEYIRDKLGFDCGRNCGVKAPVVLVHTAAGAPMPAPLWEVPISFDEYDLPVFPVDALPSAIGDYVTALAESTQTPVDMAATCSLAIMAVCSQGKYKIQAKPDWIEPLNIFTLNVMEPSERKSAVENAMVRPLNQYERDVNAQLAAELEANQMRKRILERRQKAIEEQIAKGKATEDDLVRIAQERAAFREKKPLKLFVDDVTTEKLTSVLAENDGRAAILSTEGGIFDTLAGIYTRNVNIDVILKGYSGDCIRVDRIGRNSETVMNPALTLLLMVQPSVLSGLMQNSTFRGRGLTARFLYCIPASFVGKRKYRSEPVPEVVYRAYESRIRDMLEDEYLPEPELITLSPEADLMLEAFAVELEPMLKEEYADITDWAGKLVGNTVRIAGLLCRAAVHRGHDFLLEDPDPLIVDEQTMANAIRIGRYYAAHAHAAFALMGADVTVKNSKYVLRAIRTNGLVEVTRRDVMRLCRSFKKAEELQPVLDHLVDYGYLAPKGTAAYSGKGRPPAAAYLVNPNIYSNEAAG